MTVLVGILAALLVICLGVIYAQYQEMLNLRWRLFDALDWIEPVELKAVDADWTDDEERDR